MILLDADKGKLIVEISKDDKELIDGLFSMVNSMENPNWGATETGYGAPRLDERIFEKLRDNWRSLTDGALGHAFYVGK